jgi:SAM-dependent methyltransferase
MAEAQARQIMESLVFLELCRGRGLDWRPIAAVLGGQEQLLLLNFDSEQLACVSACLREASLMTEENSPSPEVLGHVHQHLLSRRVRQGTGRGRKTTVTAETRKTSGVYYTPGSIRTYVVEHVFGTPSANESQSVLQAILDPACGGGWFLLSVCRHLLGRENRPDAETIARRLYGVDIDAEAVLAARRALWLELSAQDADSSVAIARAIADHVRCGDVLTDSVFDKADFDVVIGNPPYRRELGARQLLDRLAATPLGRRYRAPRMDLWYYFVHRSLELLRPGGRLSLVVGAYWTAGRGAEKLIRGLQQSSHIEEIVCLDRDGLFPNVAGRQMILTVRNSPCEAPTVVKRLSPRVGDRSESHRSALGPWTVFEKPSAQLFRGGRIDLEPANDTFLAQMERRTPLGQLGEVRQGIAENPASVTRRAIEDHGGSWQTGEGVFALRAEELTRLEVPETERELLRPYHDLCDLGRYRIVDQPSLVLIYSTRETCPDIDRFPILRAHLERFRPILEARRETRQGCRAWWQLHWPREERLWQSRKLVVVQMAARPAVVATRGPVYVPFSTNVFVPSADIREDLNYLAALLNSRVLWKWYRHYAKRRGVGLEINGNVLARTPIRRIDFCDPADVARHARLVELASVMAKAFDAEVDAEIDAMVEELYGVAGDEG